MIEEMLTGPEAAKAINLNPFTLARWRMQGKGPKYIRLGGRKGRTRYRRSDVEAWLEAHSATSTAQETVDREAKQ